jgi:activator of HSP90 ATPase
MTNPDTPMPVTSHVLVQRRLIVESALMFGALFAPLTGTQSIAATAAAESPSKKANRLRTSLHQEIDFKASPQHIYEALLDSKQFGAFSGEAAQIDRQPGGALSMFGGKIVGRIVELVPDERIVEAWRPANWDPGVYSMVKFELKRHDAGTRLVLDHTGFPQGGFEHLNEGWKARYWDPLAKFIA